MRHPNIAQIFEAGTFDPSREREGAGLSLPYFVMELVPEAKTITQYALDGNLGLRKRIALFLQACDAVHHGHQRSVMHRDIKPANILVDATESVKLIDFGVAKATDADVATTTVRTDAGQMVGTIQYMSPEQCEADPLGLDVRTDVYSLGIVLYELLCDRLPYDVSSLPLPSAARTICEAAPPRPSAICRALRGDLEIILLKALEKDRAKRYQSVADLARDLRHYLTGETIEVRGATTLGSLNSWIRKHPAWTTTAFAIVVSCAVLTGFLLSAFKFGRYPHEIIRSTDDRVATLISYLGNPLHMWSSNEPLGPTQVVRFSERPSDRFAIVGFSALDNGPLRRQLCAFSLVSGRFDQPSWKTQLSGNLPESIIDERKGFAAERILDPRRFLGRLISFQTSPAMSWWSSIPTSIPGE